MFAFAFALTIAAHVFAATSQDANTISKRSEGGLEFATYKKADAETLISNKSQLMQAFQAAGLPVSKIKVNESYENAYYRSLDQLTLAEGRSNSSKVDIEVAKNNVDRQRQLLEQDPRRILIYYYPAYEVTSKAHDLIWGALDLVGIEESDQVKEQRQQFLNQDPNRQTALAIGKVFIETINAASAGQTPLSDKDVQLVRGSTQANRVLVLVGSGLVNKLEQSR